MKHNPGFLKLVNDDTSAGQGMYGGAGEGSAR